MNETRSAPAPSPAPPPSVLATAGRGRPRARGLAWASLLWLALLGALGAAGPAQAADPGPPPPAVLTAYTRTLGQVERELETARLTEDRIGQAIHKVSALRGRFSACRGDMETQLARLKATLEAVAVEAEGESAPRIAEYEKLKELQTRLDAVRAECGLLVVRADDLIERLTARQRQLLTERLLVRGPDGVSLLLENLRQPTDWWTAGREFVAQQSGLEGLRRPHLAGLLLSALIAGALGLALGRACRRRGLGLQADGFGARLACASLCTFGAYAPTLFALGAVASYLTLLHREVQPLPFVDALAYGLLVLTAGLVAVRILLAPVPPACQITPLADDIARAMARRIRVLLAALLVAAMVFKTPLADHLPDHVYGLVRITVITLLVLNVVWLAWLVSRVPVWRLSGATLRRSLVLLLALAGVGEWLGYSALTDFLLRGLSETTITAIGFWILHMLLREGLDGLDSGRRGWQRALRQGLGLDVDQPVPGALWLRLLVYLVFWLALGLMLLRIWGLSDAGAVLVWRYLVDGFDVFGLRLVPAKLLLGLLLFVVLLSAVRWLSEQFERRTTFRRGMDASAREAVSKITGYVGFAIAALLALSTAGLDLSNLAIIVGALSVGIGFGLQNVVNNFVSGLILLFERPIRTGDWVAVGTTEGIVRRIKVRSTEIQTFDRSTIVVPNADLISNQVVNYTLHDTYGRLILPVGVAYGSDTALVKRLLLEVAEAHPAVVKDPTVGAPMVLLCAFAESALQFELRVILHDVGNRLTVSSDLHFAIERKFREAGVEIPYPQRKVTVEHKHLEPGAEGDDANLPPEALAD